MATFFLHPTRTPHEADAPPLVIVRQLEATPPAVATAICGLRALTDKLTIVSFPYR